MKAIIIASALALSACTPTLVPVSPSAVADTTKRDEQAVLSADLAYKGFRLAVETGVEAGVIKGQRALQISNLDRQLFSAYTLIDRAYSAGNAESLAQAIVSFNNIYRDALVTVKGSR